MIDYHISESMSTLQYLIKFPLLECLYFNPFTGWKKIHFYKIEKGLFMVAGAKALAEALKSNGVLTYMDLGYNKLEDEGGCAIIDSLLLNTSLQVFL